MLQRNVILFELRDRRRGANVFGTPGGPLAPHLCICLFWLLALAGAASAVDPDAMARQGWGKTDFAKAAVPFAEIQSGGPPKDGIPAIDEPRFVAARENANLADIEPVIRLEIDSDLRAYPLQVLTWHEIVNDTVGGVPVAVTFCPLCNAAIVFRREVNGEPTTFGTTGLLRHSDLVMYDRATESWWQQFTGEAIVGEMTGAELDMLPSRIVSFGEFRREAPDGKVLVPNDPAARPYGRNPYVGYDTRERPLLYRGEMPEGIEPMVRVVAVKDGAEPVAVALPLLVDKGQVEIGDVTLSWEPGVSSALDSDEIAKGQDVGAVKAVRRNADGTEEPVVTT